ncbi:MAG: two-component system response regulator CreB [Verrucomicrobiae bacterium]|nr:two-component system response regulator CreB [Verrucomicrobiae bacterium]
MRQRILVVEDEPSIAENITYALETEQFEFKWCATAQSGLDAWRSEPFDLAILDIGLPDMDGFEVCREIRKTSTMPIIFLTARETEIDRVVGLEMGGDDYVVKPFSPRELTARVKAVLRRTIAIDPTAAAAPTRSKSPQRCEQSGFHIDEERMEIHYHHQKLELTRYEHRLLVALANRPGRVWTRMQLMEQAWEEPDTAMERTVDAHIKTLRAKLRHACPDADDPIRTHRGTGYSMREHA